MKGKPVELSQDIVLNITLIKTLGLTINEYLILYNIANKEEISTVFTYTLKELIALEAKGFIKITRDGIVMRAKSDKMFSVVTVDLFTKWLDIYPVKVNKSRGGTRSLSPKDATTIVGKTLQKKWNMLFRKDIAAQKKAILVLELEIAEKTRSGDLEYMVEARRWLNEGYFEKYEYLIDDFKDRSQYKDEDYF